MRFAAEIQIFFQLVREAGLTSTAFELLSRPQLCSFRLRLDTFCHFTIEELDPEQIYLLTSAPAVLTRSESHFMGAFEQALPFFDRWLEALKFQSDLSHSLAVPLSELREAQPRYSLNGELALTPAERRALLPLVNQLFAYIDNSNLPQAKPLHRALGALITQTHRQPRSVCLYSLLGFLRTHGALHLPLHEAFTEISTLLIDQLDRSPADEP